MKYPQDFDDPRHKFIGAMQVDTSIDECPLFVDFNGERVQIAGAASWPTSESFAEMLASNGLVKNKQKGYTRIAIASCKGRGRIT